MSSAIRARLAASPGLGGEELERLQGSHVGLIGAGVLGGQLSLHFGLLGVTQTIIDCSSVTAENLGNQFLPWKSRGRPKSIVRAEQVSELNPEAAVRAVDAPIESLGFGALRGTSLIVTGLDSRSSRLAVNERAFRLGIPWIDAAVDGSGRKLFGTVTVYDPAAPQSPCYMCRLDRSDLASILARERGQGCPSWREARHRPAGPTLQASAFAAVVAGYQAILATEMLAGRGHGLAGTRLLIEGGLTPAVGKTRLARNGSCLFDHARLEGLTRFAGQTAGELLASASRRLGEEPTEITFPGMAVVTSLRCPACGASKEILRAARALTAEETRCSCSGNEEMSPAGIADSLSARTLDRVKEKSWAELGVPWAAVVTASTGSLRAHYIVNPPPGGAQQSDDPGGGKRA